METKKVIPAGVLHTIIEDYYLTFPHPISKDSWQSDNMTRFRVVPKSAIGMEEDKPVYPHERHIVIRGPFIIDYAEVKEILVQLTQFDLDEIEVLQSEEYAGVLDTWAINKSLMEAENGN
jgi:hypothetical protein